MREAVLTSTGLPDIERGLVVAAHPDHIGAWSGGTVNLLIASGAEVHFLRLTSGGKGIEDRSLWSRGWNPVC